MRRLKVVLVISVLVLLSSCLPNTELNERAIVEGIGIDMADGKYTVSVQYYDPEAGKTDQFETSFVKQTSDSISGAIAGINSKLSRKLYFGHNNIIVVGIDAAKRDILGIMNYFDSDGETKSDICIIITENAEKIVSPENDKQSIAPLSVMKIVENAERLGNGSDFRMYNAIRGDLGDSSAFCLPYAKVNTFNEIEISGCCVFKNGIYTSTLSKEETRGMQWYKETIKGYVMSAENLDFEVTGCETRVRTLLIGTTPTFKIQVSAKFKAPPVKMDKTTESEVSRIFSETIGWEVRKVIVSALVKSKCDLFDFSSRIAVHFPKYMKEHHDEWIQNYDADFDINVICDIM